jgi:hypothetical protein
LDWAPTLSAEEFDTQLDLQLVDLLAERRLRHVKPRRGSAKVELLRNNDEVPQPTVVDT